MPKNLFPMDDGSDAAPAYERPRLRISQVLSACTFCRTRKIKCDGVAPSCNGCTKFDRATTCSLASMTGVQLTRDYPTYLQDRIEKLQIQLQRSQDHLGSANSIAPSGLRPPFPQSKETPTSVDTLVADIGAVPVLASSYSATGNGPTLSNILLGAATKEGFTPSECKERSGRPELPGKDIAFRLVQHYIQHVYPRLPFFSLQGFWAQFNAVYLHESGPCDPSSLSADNVERECSTFTVLIVLAIASSSLSRSADSIVSNNARHLFDAALEFRESAIRPNTIVGVQSLLFLIQYATLNPSVLDAWYLIGVGVRNCIDLGLHQDPQPLESISSSLCETRRRLWWSMYSFDRSISLGCGRPTGIPDSVITAELPAFRIESTATDDQVQGYLQRYRALQIQSQIYDRLDGEAVDKQSAESIIADLSAKLDRWSMANLPEYDQTLIESEWLMSRLLLYRPCRLLPERSRQELQWLWQASGRFCGLYRQLVESNSIFYVQIASEKLYWAGFAALYSYWDLRGAGDDGSVEQTDLWEVVQDALYSIRTLSERWDDGRILAHEFELASKRLFKHTGQSTSPNTVSRDDDLGEIKDFAKYISLTSMRAARFDWKNIRMKASQSHDGELRHLVSRMIHSGAKATQ